MVLALRQRQEGPVTDIENLLAADGIERITRT
jgi:hypothetical protein